MASTSRGRLAKAARARARGGLGAQNCAPYDTVLRLDRTADDERLSVSSIPQFGVNGFQESLLDRPCQESVLDGNRSTESIQIQQKHTKSGNFGNMLSFTDCLISFECAFIQCLGARLGSQSGIARAILNQNGF